MGEWVWVGHFGQMQFRGCLVLPKSHNCQAIVMIFVWCFPCKNYISWSFWSCSWGGISCWEITTIANLHLTHCSGLKWWLPFVICHGTLFFFFRCQIPGFFHLLLLKGVIFRLHLSKAFYFFCFFYFEAVEFRIWDCFWLQTYYVVCLRITYF